MIEARGWRETAGRARRGLEGRRAFPLWLSVRKQSEPRLREATHHHHGEALITRSLTPAHIQYVTVFILHRAYSTYSSSGRSRRRGCSDGSGRRGQGGGVAGQTRVQ